MKRWRVTRPALVGHDTAAVYNSMEEAIAYVSGCNDTLKFVSQWRIPRHWKEHALNQHVHITEEEIPE